MQNLNTDNIKQDNEMNNTKTPLTIEEANQNIGKKVEFLTHTRPYSHSGCVWDISAYRFDVDLTKDTVIEEVEGGDVTVRYTTVSGKSDWLCILPKHLTLVTETSPPPQNEEGELGQPLEQKPITVEEARENIGKTVYFIESSKPFSHSDYVWGDSQYYIELTMGVTQGEILDYNCSGSVSVEYISANGEIKKADFLPKHLSFTPPKPENNSVKGDLTYKQMLEHIRNDGHAQVFIEGHYPAWKNVKDFTINELEQLDNFRKVVKITTDNNRTYLTKDTLLALLEELE